MKHRFISVALAATVLLMTADLSFAVENDAATTAGASHKVRAKGAKNEMAAKRKTTAKVKLVDINAASKAELMKLPGIGGAEADRIIAGRPYGSQAWLVSNKIIPEAVYSRINGKIMAKQHQPIPKTPAAPVKK